MDDDGSFIVLRLTGSALYDELKTSLQKITSVADDVLADTPGKTTFDWICKAVQWIEELNTSIDFNNKSSQGQLSIQKKAVAELLSMADGMLLDVPDDLRKLLSLHGIFISTNKEGRLTVKTKKGGAQHSVGTTAIRWIPILFQALKDDANRTDEWEGNVDVFLDRYSRFTAAPSSKPERSVVLQCHCLREDVRELLEQVPDLVVIPKQEKIDFASECESTLGAFLKKHTTAEIDAEFAKSILTNGNAVTNSRYMLLDALVDRRVATRRPVDESAFEAETCKLNFRDAARILIGRALNHGISNIGSDFERIKDIEGLCKLKAWEMEEALFMHFQPQIEDRMTQKYRDKVRALRRAFCDVYKCNLCLQVICSHINAEQVIRMSSEQLATPRIYYEMPEPRAKENTILTRSLSKARYPTLNARTTNGSVTEKKQQDDWCSDEDGLLLNPADGALYKSPTEKASSREYLDSASTSPPPPPPSLTGPLRLATPTLCSRRASNASGTDRFALSVGEQKFTAYLNCNSDLPSKVEDMLPERLRDDGRTRVDEFVKFLAGKQNSGNWEIYALRLLPCTDSDAKQYKRFYKDFEGKERIAMFKLGRNKLFLITPMFHQKVSDFVTLENSQSTYGVLLTRG